jgi:hypothetical protein
MLYHYFDRPGSGPGERSWHNRSAKSPLDVVTVSAKHHPSLKPQNKQDRESISHLPQQNEQWHANPAKKLAMQKQRIYLINNPPEMDLCATSQDWAGHHRILSGARINSEPMYLRNSCDKGDIGAEHHHDHV